MLYVPGGAPALKAPRSYDSKPITAQSYEGNTTVTGTPSPDNPATLTPVEPPAVTGATKQIGPLWSLPDGVKDTYDGQTGVLVRRVGRLVLDGTEDWNYIAAEANFKYITGLKLATTYAVSSHFPVSRGQEKLSINTLQFGTFVHSNLYINWNDSSDLATFKAFLAAQSAAGTPVTVLYELAQPVVERIVYTGHIAIRATDILAPSWTGKTTVTGEPSPDNPTTITGVPFAATATGPNGETHSVDLGFTGYSLPNGVADTYDGVRGDFVQRVGRLVLDGTESWVASSFNANASYLSYRFLITVSSLKRYTGEINFICSHFNSVDISDTSNLAIYGISQNTDAPYDNQIILTSPKGNNPLFSSIDTLKSWLAAQYAAGTPVVIYYEMAEPIAYNRKADMQAFEGSTTVTGADTVEVIEGRVERIADYAYYEIVRSNPNLLDNAYFLNPINQRGNNEYTGIGYNIDRWLTYYYDGTTIELTEQGLHLTATGTYIFRQRIMPLIKAKNLFNGKPITLSFLVDGDLTTTTYVLKKDGSNDFESWGNRVGNSRALIRVENKNLSCELYGGVGSHNIITAKLEEGPTQTLARKVGDQWVLNDPPPDPTLELLKCQRYFQIFATESLRPTDKDDFRPTMIATPKLGNIVINGKTYYTASAEL